MCLLKARIWLLKHVVDTYILMKHLMLLCPDFNMTWVSHSCCMKEGQESADEAVLLLLNYLCCCCLGGGLEIQESDPEEPPTTARHCGIIQHRPPVRTLMPRGIWRQPRMGQKSTWNALRYFICDRECMKTIEYGHWYSNPASLHHEIFEYYLKCFLQHWNVKNVIESHQSNKALVECLPPQTLWLFINLQYSKLQNMTSYSCHFFFNLCSTVLLCIKCTHVNVSLYPCFDLFWSNQYH